MKLNGNNIKIAIQKEGRLTEGSLALLKATGLVFATSKSQLYSSCENFPLDILFVRDDDIPEYVRDGVCDMGIVGLDVVKECDIELGSLAPLSFGASRLVIAAPKESAITKGKELTGKRIATSYPRILSKFLKGKKITARIVTLSGSVELACSLGVADAICDLVSTGSTLKTHELVPLVTVFQSEAVLVGRNRPVLKVEKRVIFEQFKKRCEAVLKAERAKYIMLNAPKEKVEAIARIIPGVKSPTVIPLAKRGWVAMHSVISEDIFWQTIDKLKSLGAQGILVLPIEKIIL